MNSIFISPQMTGSTIQVLLRMTHCTIYKAGMNFMMLDRPLLKILMTVLTFRQLREMIPILYIFTRGVHLFTAMTINTHHAAITIMDITLTIGSKKISRNWNGMTGGALINKIWFGLKHMAIIQAAADYVWSAYVTGAAGIIMTA